MDLNFLGNAALFMVAIGLQFAWLFGGSSGSGTSAGEEEPLYDPTAYSGETFGTEADDTISFIDEGLNRAYFLGAGDDTLNASGQADFADGGAGDDVLMMRLGDDIALGGEGNDTIDGGLGNDQLYGGAGDDTITGNKGDDQIFGGSGNDILIGSQGDDIVNGGAGDDILYGHLPGDAGTAANGIDILDGGAGDDVLHLSGGDTGTGGAGADGFMLYTFDLDPNGNTIAAITDFNPAEDIIEVVYPETLDSGTGLPVPPDLTVTATDDGTGSTIALNGIDIGLVTGGQALTPDDITLIPA